MRGTEGAEWIVVGTDGSERAAAALELAIALARSRGVGLHVVHGYSDAASAAFAPELMPHVDPRRGADDALARACDRARASGVPAQAHCVRGSAADALISVADAYAASMIVVGNKGMRARRRFLLGNVPEKLSHHAPCSVLIAHTG